MHFLDVIIFLISLAIFFSIYLCRVEYAKVIIDLSRRFLKPTVTIKNHGNPPLTDIPQEELEAEKKAPPLPARAIKVRPEKHLTKTIYKNAVRIKSLKRKELKSCCNHSSMKGNSFQNNPD